MPLDGTPPAGRGWRWLAGGLVIGGLAAWMVFANTDMAAVWAVLSGELDYRLAGAALLAYALFFLCKAQRWRFLLRPLIEVNLTRLTAYVLIGYAGNVLVPMQAGEIARGYLIARQHGIRPAAALSGIALEKVLDFFALLLLLACALWGVAAPSPLVQQAAAILAVLLSLIALILLLALVRPEATAVAIDRVAAGSSIPLVRKLAPLLHDGLNGVAALRQGGLLVKILMASLATWVAMLAALWLTTSALELEVSLAGAAIVLVLAAVGLALPTSPGFIGTLQAAFVFGLVPLGTSQEAAVAASLLYQALTTIPPVAAGAIAWLRLQGAPG